jgi:hypothetical protein
MPVMKRECEICKHSTQQMSGCGRPDCSLAESSGIEGIHDHCAEDHAPCTSKGCRGVPVPTGFVNPDLVSGEVPDPMSKSALRSLVTEVTGGFTDDSESEA